MARAVTSPLTSYIDHLKRGELGYQFSPSANQAVFYPRLIAPRTRAMTWNGGSARAGHRACHHRGASTGGRAYNVRLVDTDEGFRMMSRVEDIAPTAVKIGLRVKFRVHAPGGDKDPYPVFIPAEAV